MAPLPLVLLVLLAALAGAGAALWLAGRRRQGRALYRAELEKALEDGVLTPEERAQLDRVRVERDLSEAEVRLAALALYRRALGEAMADSRVTAEEDRALARLQAQLGLTDADLAPERGHIERLHLLARLERGVLPVVGSPVALSPGDTAHWVVHATFCEWLGLPGRGRAEPAHLGFDVEDTQPFHADGPRGSLGSNPHVLPVDLGVLVVTGRALLFRGAKRRLDVPYARFVRLSLYRDGIRATLAGPATGFSFLTADPELTAAVLLRAARNSRQDDAPALRPRTTA